MPARTCGQRRRCCLARRALVRRDEFDLQPGHHVKGPSGVRGKVISIPFSRSSSRAAIWFSSLIRIDVMVVEGFRYRYCSCASQGSGCKHRRLRDHLRPAAMLGASAVISEVHTGRRARGRNAERQAGGAPNQSVPFATGLYPSLKAQRRSCGSDGPNRSAARRAIFVGIRTRCCGRRARLPCALPCACVGQSRRQQLVESDLKPQRGDAEAVGAKGAIGAPRPARARVRVSPASTAGSTASTITRCARFSQIAMSLTALQTMSSAATRPSRIPSGVMVTTAPCVVNALHRRSVVHTAKNTAPA
jgi:hypothetical protein